MREYFEYPKWVTKPSGEQVLVNDGDEEATALAGDNVVRDADEKARLLKVGQVKGVDLDGRWSAARMAEAITAAGFDPTLNPDV